MNTFCNSIGVWFIANPKPKQCQCTLRGEGSRRLDDIVEYNKLRPQILECKLREIPPDEGLYTTYNAFQLCEHASRWPKRWPSAGSSGSCNVNGGWRYGGNWTVICSNSRFNSSAVARNVYDIVFDIAHIARSHTLMYKQNISLTYAGYTRGGVSYLF